MSKPITGELYLFSEIRWKQNLCHIDPKFLTARFIASPGFKEKVEAVAAPAISVSEDQMEKELLAAWNYYLDASDRQETLNPLKKKMGLAVVSRIRKQGFHLPVLEMSKAIDMARQLARENPKKKFLFRWTSMFSKWNTFVSLWQEYRDSDRGIPDAAALPEEYLPPKPPPPPPPTPEEKARAAEERARVDAVWKEAVKRMREREAKETTSRQVCETVDSPF